MITTETIQILIWPAAGVLTAISLLAMAALGVFSPRPLRLAPPRRSALSLLLAGGLLALYLFTVIIALILTGYKGPPQGASPTIGQITHSAAADAVVRILMVALMAVLAGLLTRGGLHAWGLSLRRLPGGIALGLLAVLLIASPIYLVMRATDYLDQIFHRQTPIHPVLRILQEHPPVSTTILLVFSAAVLAPFAEEFFFRGILQTALIQRNPFSLNDPSTPLSTGILGFPLYPGLPTLQTPSADPHGTDLPAPTAARRWIAILISSTFFTFMHGQVEFFPVLMVLAIALGYLYERTGNLWAPITLHAAFNTTSLVLTLCFPNASN